MPYLDLNTEYYDLCSEYRNETNDNFTFDSAYATKKYGVADKLEKDTIKTIDDGVMMGDLYALSSLLNKQKVNTQEHWNMRYIRC